jgi:hypothetical protein
VGVVVEAVEGGLRNAVAVEFEEVEQQHNAVSLEVLAADHLQDVLHHEVEQLRPLPLAVPHQPQQVQEGQVDVDHLRVVLVVLHLRHPPLEARVVAGTHVVQQQPLETTLGVEDAKN